MFPVTALLVSTLTSAHKEGSSEQLTEWIFIVYLLSLWLIHVCVNIRPPGQDLYIRQYPTAAIFHPPYEPEYDLFRVGKLTGKNSSLDTSGYPIGL
jgi:hypothetical protein